MKAEKSTYSAIDAKKFGIVIRGCAINDGNDENWIKGITEHLVEAGVLKAGTTPEQAWEQALYTTTLTMGRNDLVLYAKEGAEFHIGIMAMWRLSFQGQISWIDDWKANDSTDYGVFVPRDLYDHDD